MPTLHRLAAGVGALGLAGAAAHAMAFAEASAAFGDPAAAPDPAWLGLLGAGLVAAGMLCRRRARHRRGRAPG